MSKYEENFKKVLDSNSLVGGVDYFMQYPINVDVCRLFKSGSHKVDFVINNKNGEKLYIEVKGLMTYEACSILRYLLHIPNHNFYILQLSESTWPINKNEQYADIINFYNGTIDAGTLKDKSKALLEEYCSFHVSESEQLIKQIDPTIFK